MNNAKLAKHLNENFICTYKQVSVFKAASRRRPAHRVNGKDFQTEEVSKVGGNVASYFCDPNGRVLELVVGPVSAARLIDSSERSLNFYNDIKRLTFDKQILQARKHLVNLVTGDQALAKFAHYNGGSRWKHNQPVLNQREPNINQIARSSYYVIHELASGQTQFWDHGNEVFQIYSNGYGDFPTQLTSSRTDKTPRLRYKENLLLAEAPLARIEEIEKDVFQILVGQPYRIISSEYKIKLAEFQRLRNGDKHIVAVLLDSPKASSRPEPFQEPDLREIRTFGGIKNQSDCFGIVYVTYDELFGILSDSRLEPMSQDLLDARQIRKRGIGFVLFNPEGETQKILPSGTNTLALSNAMRRTAK